MELCCVWLASQVLIVRSKVHKFPVFEYLQTRNWWRNWRWKTIPSASEEQNIKNLLAYPTGVLITSAPGNSRCSGWPDGAWVSGVTWAREIKKARKKMFGFIFFRGRSGVPLNTLWPHANSVLSRLLLGDI